MHFNPLKRTSFPPKFHITQHSLSVYLKRFPPSLPLSLHFSALTFLPTKQTYLSHADPAQISACNPGNRLSIVFCFICSFLAFLISWHGNGSGGVEEGWRAKKWEKTEGWSELNVRNGLIKIHSPPPPPSPLGIGDEEIRGLKLYPILQREMEKMERGELINSPPLSSPLHACKLHCLAQSGKALSNSL